MALEKYHWRRGIDHVHHAGYYLRVVDGAAIVAIGGEIGRGSA